MRTRDRYFGSRSSASRCARSIAPSASRRTSTTVAKPSRHDTSLEWCSNGPTNTTGCCARRCVSNSRRALLADARVEFVDHSRARCRRAIDAENLLQFVDRAGGAGADRDDASVRSRIDGCLDRSFGFAQQLRHVAAGRVVFGVRVRVGALQALQIVLDEQQAAAGRGVVAIHHQTFAERRGERGVDADDLLSKEFETRGWLHGGLSTCGTRL